MSDTAARTPVRRRILGLLAAGLAVWLFIVLLTFGPEFVQGLAGGSDPYWLLRLRNGLILAVIFGLPIALGASLLVGIPLWALAERSGLRSRRAGLLWGALAGLGIGGLGTLHTAMSSGPGSSYSADGVDIIVDGQLTASGWAEQLQTALEVALLGALVGPLAVHIARRRLPLP